MFFHLMKLCVKFSFSTLRLDFPNCLPNVLNLLLKRDKSSCAGQVTEPGVSCRLQQVQLLPVSRALHSHTSTAVCVVYTRELIYLLQFTSAAAESWSREKSKHCQPLIRDSSRHLHTFIMCNWNSLAPFFTFNEICCLGINCLLRSNSLWPTLFEVYFSKDFLHGPFKLI